MNILTKEDLAVVAQGLALVLIEQTGISQEAGELLAAMDEGQLTEVEGTTLTDVRVMLEGAKTGILRVQEIFERLKSDEPVKFVGMTDQDLAFVEGWHAHVKNITARAGVGEPEEVKTFMAKIREAKEEKA